MHGRWQERQRHWGDGSWKASRPQSRVGCCRDSQVWTAHVVQEVAAWATAAHGSLGEGHSPYLSSCAFCPFCLAASFWLFSPQTLVSVTAGDMLRGGR